MGGRIRNQHAPDAGPSPNSFSADGSGGVVGGGVDGSSSTRPQPVSSARGYEAGAGRDRELWQRPKRAERPAARK